EWNAYRYEAVPGGVVLLGISRRGYGQDDGRRFLAEELAENRQAWINELAGMDLPAVAPVRWRCPRRPPPPRSSSSSTNLLPKKASTNRPIATRVRRTALAPRQP